MKYAVIYFSWSGNTRFAAETVAKKAGADLVFDSMQDFADTLPLILDITASR